VNKAIQTAEQQTYWNYRKLQPKAANKSIGLCGMYVRQAVQTGLGENTGERWSKYAKDYGPFLEARGFSRVAAENYVPQRGDIAVISGTDSVPAGHVQIYQGERWISDFQQRIGGGMNIFINDDEQYTVYRSSGEIPE
jgi:hypothetical protein